MKGETGSISVSYEKAGAGAGHVTAQGTTASRALQGFVVAVAEGNRELVSESCTKRVCAPERVVLKRGWCVVDPHQMHQSRLNRIQGSRGDLQHC